LPAVLAIIVIVTCFHLYCPSLFYSSVYCKFLQQHKTRTKNTKVDKCWIGSEQIMMKEVQKFGFEHAVIVSCSSGFVPSYGDALWIYMLK
jgi:hypothetical protein